MNAIPESSVIRSSSWRVQLCGCFVVTSVSSPNTADLAPSEYLSCNAATKLSLFVQASIRCMILTSVGGMIIAEDMLLSSTVLLKVPFICLFSNSASPRECSAELGGSKKARSGICGSFPKAPKWSLVSSISPRILLFQACFQANQIQFTQQ